MTGDNVINGILAFLSALSTIDEWLKND